MCPDGGPGPISQDPHPRVGLGSCGPCFPTTSEVIVFALQSVAACAVSVDLLCCGHPPGQTWAQALCVPGVWPDAAPLRAFRSSGRGWAYLGFQL